MPKELSCTSLRTSLRLAPRYFTISLKKNPLGTLFTNGKSRFDANHIPFELHAHEGQQGVLHSHVAGTSPICQDLATGDEVLIDFRAADAYIAPNWYPSKVESKKQVPSWNYMVAHVYGRVTIRDDERMSAA